MKPFLSLSLLLLSFTFPILGFSEEIDQFTDRVFQIQNLPESLTWRNNPLDQKMNETLGKVKERLNENPKISPEARDKIVESEFQHPILKELITPYAEWVIHNSPVPLFYPISRGVYGFDVDFDDMKLAWYIRLSPILKASDVLQGTDKIGHFIAQGWQYYEKYKALKKELPSATEEVLLKLVRKYGFETENGNLGIETGGVFSYADLLANWRGFLFFKTLFEKKGYLGLNESGRYELMRNFTWRDYITDGWDEVILPSRAVNQAFYDKFATNLHRQKLGGKKSICETYRENPSLYLNKQGKPYSLSEFTWEEDPYLKGELFLDVLKICRK